MTTAPPDLGDDPSTSSITPFPPPDDQGAVPSGTGRRSDGGDKRRDRPIVDPWVQRLLVGSIPFVVLVILILSGRVAFVKGSVKIPLIGEVEVGPPPAKPTPTFVEFPEPSEVPSEEPDYFPTGGPDLACGEAIPPLTVDSGKVQVPFVLGQPVADAITSVNRNGLVARPVCEPPQASSPCGDVQSTDPVAGTEMDQGQEVLLRVRWPCS